MNPILRAAAVYAFMIVVVRISGRRTLGEMTSFDFILLMLISETTQNAMVGEDNSLTNCFLIILTLVTIDIGLSLIKRRSRRVEKWIDGVPTVLVEDGRVIKDRMEKARVSVEDVMEAARELQGLERMDQIKYAVLERGGQITIIPKSIDKA